MLLNIIYFLKVSNSHEKSLTQKLCHKCSTQLSNSYKFVVQARKVYEQYIQSLKEMDDDGDNDEVEHNDEEENKDFEDIPEPLLEVPIDLHNTILTKESPLAAVESPLVVNEIKTEPMTVEYTTNEDDSRQNDNLTIDNDIKEEKPEYIDYKNTATTSSTEESIGKSIEELPKEPLIDATNDDDR